MAADEAVGAGDQNAHFYGFKPVVSISRLTLEW